MIPPCDRPLATTSQFRAAVRQILHTFTGRTYTDKTKANRPSSRNAKQPTVDNGTRYVLCYTEHPSAKAIEAIEFILWSQGVTANTRGCAVGTRGTCVMPLNLKEKQNV